MEITIQDRPLDPIGCALSSCSERFTSVRGQGVGGVWVRVDPLLHLYPIAVLPRSFPALAGKVDSAQAEDGWGLLS